jgi:hypothetical protein
MSPFSRTFQRIRRSSGERQRKPPLAATIQALQDVRLLYDNEGGSLAHWAVIRALHARAPPPGGTIV